MAALVSAAAGLEVVVLESSDLIGGTTAMSGAGTWIPANHKAAAAGLDDSSQDALDYIRACAPPGWQAIEDTLWQRFVVEAPRMLKFVEERTPLVFDLADDSDPYPQMAGARRSGRMLSPRALPGRIVGAYAGKIRAPHVPHILTYQETRRFDAWHHPAKAVLRNMPQVVCRLARRSRAQGTALVRGLLAGYLAAGGHISLNTQALGLITNEEGAVIGVEVSHAGGTMRLAAQQGVVLACGGFERDAVRRRKHFPAPTDLIASAPSNTGDAHAMAEAVGAELARMDQANIAPAIPAMHKGQAQPLGTFHHREPAAILVGPDGRRFVNEYLFNLGEVLLEKDATSGRFRHLPAWLISDRSLLRASPVMNYFLRGSKTWIRRSRSIDELASQIGVPGPALMETVSRFNRFAREGTDQDFQRHVDPLSSGELAGRRLAPIARPPYVAMPFNLSFLSTKGGPRTDNCGRVLRPGGRPIPGLFCAGVAMANPFGTRAIGQGTTIGPNMTWGWICGRYLTRQLSPDVIV